MTLKMAAIGMLGLIAGLAFSNLAPTPRLEGQQTEPGPQWEYKTVHTGPVNTALASPDPSGVLNQHGAAGWELAGVIGGFDRQAVGKVFSFVLKRAKQKKAKA